jgi:hypothetical protein
VTDTLSSSINLNNGTLLQFFLNIYFYFDKICTGYITKTTLLEVVMPRGSRLNITDETSDSYGIHSLCISILSVCTIYKFIMTYKSRDMV